MIAFNLNYDHPLAAYEQIKNQILFGIASQRFKPGEKLPSVRELATEVGVNPNTIMKAYGDLELLGLLETRRGVGVSVSHDAYSRTREKTRSLARRSVQDAVAECLAAGMDGREVRELVHSLVETVPVPYDPETGPRKSAFRRVR